MRQFIMTSKVWLITRTPKKRHDGLKLTMWDSDTGFIRFGQPLGYVESEEEAYDMLKYYRNHARGYDYKFHMVHQMRLPK